MSVGAGAHRAATFEERDGLRQLIIALGDDFAGLGFEVFFIHALRTRHRGEINVLPVGTAATGAWS